MRPHSRLQRKWEVFPGRNQFFCDGRVVMAKQASMFYLTIGLILLPSILFLAIDAPYLASEVSWTIPLAYVVLLIFTLGNVFMAACSDPGEELLLLV